MELLEEIHAWKILVYLVGINIVQHTGKTFNCI